MNYRVPAWVLEVLLFVFMLAACVSSIMEVMK